MTAISRPTAITFLEAFLDAYGKVRSQLDKNEWNKIWDSKAEWNRMMLYKNPPNPLKKTVMQEIADDLNLEYRDWDAFRLDVVLIPRDAPQSQNFPLPIAVALEHELEHAGFKQEIAKLLAVRSSLKVGITYCDRSLEPIREQIWKRYDLFRRYVGEALDTEYLFIVGTAQGRDISWKSSQFSGNAADIPPFTDCIRQKTNRSGVL